MYQTNRGSESVNEVIDTCKGSFAVGRRLALGSQFTGFPSSTSENLNTQRSLNKSDSIPIHKNRTKRTPSEVQLHQDEELAEFRDYIMFTRIVDRMSRSQKKIVDHQLRYENHLCIAHVIGTRNGTPEADIARKELQRVQDLKQIPHTMTLSTYLYPCPPSSFRDTHARVISETDIDGMLIDKEANIASYDTDDDDFIFDLDL